MSEEINISSCPAYAVMDSSCIKKKVTSNIVEECKSNDEALYNVVNALEEPRQMTKHSNSSPSISLVGKSKLSLLVLSLVIVVVLTLVICIAFLFSRMAKISMDLEDVRNKMLMNELILRSEIEHLHNTSFFKLSDKVTVSNSELASRITELNSLYEYISSVLNATVGGFGSYLFPAHSCEAIYQSQVVPTSGYYWLRSANESSVEVYCEMTITCGGSRGGRMRVVLLNDNTRSGICSDKLNILDSNRSRCALTKTNAGDCSGNIFNVMNIQYSHICGTVEGYGLQTIDGFKFRSPQSSTSDNYVDGISITLNNPNTTHVWTFVAVQIGETPCPNMTPPFVGGDYSCLPFINRGTTFICSGDRCSPSFKKTLIQPTSDNIKIRLCRDQEQADEDIVVGNIEIYVW